MGRNQVENGDVKLTLLLQKVNVPRINEYNDLGGDSGHEGGYDNGTEVPAN